MFPQGLQARRLVTLPGGPLRPRLTRRRDVASITVVTALISHTSIDCRDAYALSVFWRNVLGFVQDDDNPDHPGDPECMIFSADKAQRLLFIEVPEAKSVKNRIHLDLVPADGTRDDELARLLAIGARTVDDRRHEDGSGWVVLADPEGNEFCILRNDAERAG
jgi:catechol 2,3-dioxygenase-like lactoylglutathione lyase family enzyme